MQSDRSSEGDIGRRRDILVAVRFCRVPLVKENARGSGNRKFVGSDGQSSGPDRAVPNTVGEMLAAWSC